METIFKEAIPTSAVKAFLKKFDSIQNKIVKFGIRSLEISVGEDYISKVAISSGNVDRWITPIEVKGEMPVLCVDGYTYVGTIKRAGENNLIFPIKPEYENILMGYNNIPHLPCHHCNTKRKRSKVHVFVNTQGEEKIIASSCSKEYWGIDVENVIGNIFFYSQLEQYIRSYIPQQSAEFHSNVYSKIVYAVIKKDNCLHPASQYDSTALKSNMHYDTYRGITTDKFDKDQLKKILDSVKEWDETKLFEYWKCFDAKTSFENNVRSAIFGESLNASFFVWAVYLYMIAAGDIADPKAITAESLKSEYVGKVGEKLDLKKATVVSQFWKDTGYSAFYVVKLVDPSGNFYTVFDSSDRFDVGDSYSFSSTVKSHSEYNGVKSTVLTRLSKFRII